MWKVWIRPSLTSETTHLRLYNCCMLPILLYNSGTWELTQTGRRGPENFHRRQLGKIIGGTSRTLSPTSTSTSEKEASLSGAKTYPPTAIWKLTSRQARSQSSETANAPNYQLFSMLTFKPFPITIDFDELLILTCYTGTHRPKGME
ncbi:hypothetical protein PHMEG_00022377 [Phytophthora megakarya]|uniref:Uncharacterized protein n=1 Tax=Phytophthora megakarya TaxID=4795 RepID=A0A225VJD5_9STRA|nr:hypothetical protein PHMEG_00022377 [Phytophthora megakarya]